MGWSGPMPNAQGRMVGYAVEAVCDLDGCEAKIDRGLAYVCGDMHDGGEFGCGLYFCYEHLFFGLACPEQLCEACGKRYDEEHPEEVAAAIAEFEEKRKQWVQNE